ncbi:MAG: glycosyltransferase [Sphingobacteriales bacterium]|nr:MAG: glycosyltransferase [Sphingobacteriales bacterium]
MVSILAGLDGISVIVCCYNSASRLPQTISCIVKQKHIEHLNIEIIIVDNSSLDDTSKIATEEFDKYKTSKLSFKLLHETNMGLSHARAKGISNSCYETIIFCDDDNRLDENYLMNAFHIMNSNPKIGALGGMGIARTDIPTPEWFETCKDAYAVGTQADRSGFVTKQRHIWGAGIVLRRSIFQKAYSNFPSILTGRSGKQLSAGEDSEMCIRFILMGYELYYSSELKFYHYIPNERLTLQYKERLFEGFANSQSTFKKYYLVQSLNEMSLKHNL